MGHSSHSTLMEYLGIRHTFHYRVAPGDYSLRGSHRAGRARLAHPVPQHRDSLRDDTGGTALTRYDKWIASIDMGKLLPVHANMRSSR